MSCAVTHGPAVVAMSLAMSAAKAGVEPYCEPKEMCPAETARLLAAELAEDAMFCQVMCCCKDAKGSNGRAARQLCVQDTLDAADTALGNQSQYKAEISYNMMVKPPSPFMHRKGNGLQRSTHWQTRARQEIEDYKQGEDMVRRPDVVITRDPTLPPTQDNIERIVEMKFKNDPDDDEQIRDYNKIAGPKSTAKILREESCDCSEGERDPVPEPVPVPVPSPKYNDRVVRIPEPSVGTWAVVGLGVVFVAAVLFPFDGPVGDVVAGTAFFAALGVN